MFPLVVIFAGVAIAATTASWILGGMTETEKKRQNKLSSELSELKKKFDFEVDGHNQNMYEFARDNYDYIKNKFLNEVSCFKEEKKNIKKDLDTLSISIQKELMNKSISPYQKQSLLDNRNKVEDAKNRLDAYWLYLDWFEKKLEDLAKYKKYPDIFDLEVPQPLLPEEYLYIGKLAYIEKEELSFSGDKKSGWNKYDQKLSLNDYHNKKELELVNSYISQQEFMILIDFTKDNKHFSCSAIKGVIYQSILEDLSFDVHPKFNEKPNQEELTLLYDGVYLKIKRVEKLYPLKRYKEYDEFEVKVKEYDLLLKNIFVTEKLANQQNDISTNKIPIIFEFNHDLSIEAITKLNDSLQGNSFQVISLEDNELLLKVDNFLLHIEVILSQSKLRLKNISTIEISKFNTKNFVLPYDILLIEKEIYLEEYKNFYVGGQTLFNEFIGFVTEQLNYIEYSSKTKNKDFEFFKKWQRIIDYQIEDNSYDMIKATYKSYQVEGHILTLNIENLKSFKDLLSTKRPKDITLEINGLAIGILDDYSIEENIIKLKIDMLDELDISKKGLLFFKVKNYQAVLQKQKKALKDFAFSKIVNQDLKQMLISPSLITYQSISQDINLTLKNNFLTKNQQNIIHKSFNEKNIFLIQGPPGTGKTTVIKELIFQTITQNSYAKILIVSQQNVAVDNVLDGIDRENKEWFSKEGHSIIRVAPNENKIQYENIKQYTVEKWFERYKKSVLDNFIKLEQKKEDKSILKNILNTFSQNYCENSEYNNKLYKYSKDWLDLIYKDEFREIDNEIKELLIGQHQILGATCVGLANKSLGLDLVEFDIAIIDEAGRATSPELLIPILRAKKVILIGDHNQLPPTIDRKLLEKLESDNEEDLDLEDLEILKKSFFEELFEKIPESNKAMLDEQFRMPEKIGNLISQLFYDKKLKNGHIKDTKNFIHQKTLQWINIDGEHQRDGTSSYNEKEIDSIVKLVEKINEQLIKRKLQKSIGIITPYSAQKRRIRKEIKDILLSNVSNIKIDTVDSFQGEEAEIIIYSTVKTYGNISFLIDKKRLNVAISRTQENLFFIGKKDFFYNFKTKKDEVNLFKSIIDFIETN